MTNNDPHMAGTHNIVSGYSGGRILAGDVRQLVRDFPGCTLKWSMAWLSQYYGGTTVREYPASLGAAEILRQIKCERADRRMDGRCGNETLIVLEG